MRTMSKSKKYWVSFLNASCLRSFEHYEEAVEFQNARINNGDYSAKIIK